MGSKFSLNEKEKKFCVSLARKSIEYFFSGGALLKLSEKVVPKNLLEEKACFVTLTNGSELRGCIGHLDAMQPLYLDIIENAVNAAFQDSRFNPLSKNELSDLKIEVSVLTDAVEMKFSSPADLLKKIVAGKDGLIIRKGFRSATFLPSVWEEIETKEEFLSHLCLKAGLAPDEWVRLGMRVFRYGAILATEEQE
ncbi:MAG: AmmeMemoRadiSam system protein A [Candidatus Diapherotrites archaeon]|nr:AmmeMemoRadiSam system protein A [Candidatus Diapherotrites archaeon]